MIRNWGTFPRHDRTDDADRGRGARAPRPNKPCRRSTHGNSRAVARFRCICATAPVAWPSLLKLRG